MTSRAQARAPLPHDTLRDGDEPLVEQVHQVEDVVEARWGLVRRQEAVLVHGVAQGQPVLGVAPGGQAGQVGRVVGEPELAEEELVAQLEGAAHRPGAEVEPLVQRGSPSFQGGLRRIAERQIRVVDPFVRRAGPVRGDDLDEAELPIRVDEDHTAFGDIECPVVHDFLQVEL